MVVRAAVIVTVLLVVAITVIRGVRAADWVLLRQDASGDWHQRGPMLDQQTACLTALASDGIVVPSGTRLTCRRVISTKEATR